MRTGDLICVEYNMHLVTGMLGVIPLLKTFLAFCHLDELRFLHLTERYLFICVFLYINSISVYGLGLCFKAEMSLCLFITYFLSFARLLIILDLAESRSELLVFRVAQMLWK